MSNKAEELVLPQVVKEKLQLRLQPIVAAGALPKNETSPESRQLNAQLQAVIGKILEEELPNDFIEKFKEIQNRKQQAVVFKNFPTLEWMLPPTPDEHDFDSIGGYSNLILRGLSQLSGKVVSYVQNIVSTESSSQETPSYEEKLSKHRDSGKDEVNALFCLRSLNVATNLYAFDDLAKHPKISPYLDILKSDNFEIHVLDDDDQVSEIKGPFPVFRENEEGGIHGTEISSYRKSGLYKIVPQTEQAQEAWKVLCDLIKSDALQPSVSVVLEKGDILIMHDMSGLHDRDAYLVPEEQFARRWLKRASEDGKIQIEYSPAELQKLEAELPALIKNSRLAEAMEEPYYAAFLQQHLER